MKYLLLTGATGLLGRYLLRDLLLADMPVAVLARPTRRATVRQRIESMMCYWDEQTGRDLPRPVVLEGDICEENLGLDARGLAWVAAHCDTFLHNAASLTFQSTGGPDSEPWRSNVQGMRNSLEVCRRAGIRKFHHVSTAYVCGLRTGRILESDVDVGQTPGNDYERSKLMAEQMVRSADFIDTPTIYRPAIIIGDSETGYTTTFHGFYAPLQLVHTMVRAIEPDECGTVHSHARLALNGTESKNFVPVEWVSAAMTRIFLQPDRHGQTYHLTPRVPVQVRLIRDVLERTTGFYAAKFLGGNSTFENMTDYEQLFIDHMRIYNSYWRDDPAFDTTNTDAAVPELPCPHVDLNMLLKLANWAISTNFGNTRAQNLVPDFDTHLHLKPMVKAGANQIPGRLLGLQVDGHGGGQWHLVYRDGGLVAIDVGLDDRCSATYRLDSSTFGSLANGTLTVDEAVATGNVVISGNGLPKTELSGVLQQLATPIAK